MEIKIPNVTSGRSYKNEQPWLLSYSDMVTLLLAFFVLFFAISQIDQVKFEMIMEYFSKNETMPLHVLEQRFKELIQAHNLQEQVDVELTPDGLEIRTGLVDGDLVVTAGVSKIHDGLTVKLLAR